MSTRCPRTSTQAVHQIWIAIPRRHSPRTLIRLAALGTAFAAATLATSGCSTAPSKAETTQDTTGSAQVADPHPLLLTSADLPGYHSEKAPEITHPASDHPQCVDAMNQVEMEPPTTPGAFRASSFFQISPTNYWLNEAINSYRNATEASADLARFKTALAACPRYNLRPSDIPFPLLETITSTNIGLTAPGFTMHIEVSAPGHPEAPPIGETLAVLQQGKMLVILSHGGPSAPPQDGTRQIAMLALQRVSDAGKLTP
jgi:hypothetical protein